ncbi:MAG TPA: helix-turn-helix domain-containing protein [Thermoanaerobaculaceae bacterium]|nr:helix-turn-helix domain-containing protein [Thermoanaerobaculaceae bacterium]
MPTYFCPYCGKETRYLNVSEAAAMAQVTRTTVYSWMRKREVHSVHRPSGRRFICAVSLLVNEAFEGDGAAHPPRPAHAHPNPPHR